MLVLKHVPATTQLQLVRSCFLGATVFMVSLCGTPLCMVPDFMVSDNFMCLFLSTGSPCKHEVRTYVLSYLDVASAIICSLYVLTPGKRTHGILHSLQCGVVRHNKLYSCTSHQTPTLCAISLLSGSCCAWSH